MGQDIERETFVIHNPDGSVSMDPYAGMSRDALKNRCGELCRALSDWQMIAMVIAEHGKEDLSLEDRNKVERLIEAYKD